MSSFSFNRDLIQRYDVRGPRYTSYPTADRFATDFTVDDYLAAAGESNNPPIPSPLSLYVHVPFCYSLCHYCACNKIITRHREKCIPYLQRLLREAHHHAALYDQDRLVTQLHFGGGTPTYFDDEQLGKLLDGLAKAFNFTTGTREFSIEVDPRTVDAERVRTLADLGFNRMSIGVQDFDPDVQQAVNRLQSVEQVQEALGAARAAGFQSISFDLIYGLPRQTVASFKQTLALVQELGPDRISVYNYAHLPDRFRAQRLIKAAELPSANDKLAILDLTLKHLDRAGYEYIGMDHFALPKDELAQARAKQTLQRNFQGYSTHAQCDLVGLGVSAISHIGPTFCQNESSLKQWQNMVDAGQLPIMRGLAMSIDDQIRADVIQRIMCHSSLYYADIERRWDIDFANYFAEQVAALDTIEQDGLIEIHQQGFDITPSGRMLLRNIAMCFDHYLSDEHERGFSRVM